MVDVPGSSVAHSSVPSDASAARSFDVGKQGDLLALLNFIRRGPFEQDEKRMLRDAVLDYTVNQKQEILTVISTAVSGKGAVLLKDGSPLTIEKQGLSKETSEPAPEQEQVPEIVATASEETSRIEVGYSRPQPSFGAPAKPLTADPAATAASMKAKVADAPVKRNVTNTPADTPAPTSASEPEKEAVDSAVKAEPVSQSSIPDVATPDYSKTESVQNDVQPAQETSKGLFVSEPKAAILSEEKTESVPEATAVTPPESAVPPSPTPEEPAVMPDTAPATAPSKVSHGDPLERIKEIKRLVNEKVGNPVNLIDANNTVGREYMNALLNAMRVVNGGAEDDVALAMDRLEKAYQSVETTIDSGETVIGVQNEPVAVPVSETTSEISKEAVVAPTDGPSAIPSSAPNEPTLAAPAVTPTPAASELPDFPERETTSQTLSSEAQTDVSPMPEAVADTPVPVPQPAGTPASLADKLRTEQASRDSLIAQRSRELELDQVKENATDPLQSNAVSAGLQQLLGEWKLFKSSGLFGTGPSGYEHPLYKKLSAMPMSAVIAGRFDGGTPEIKQSIADYMNGWRYEQGVVHEMNETFEHYLRRVIKAILDKQKAPKA